MVSARVRLFRACAVKQILGVLLECVRLCSGKLGLRSLLALLRHDIRFLCSTLANEQRDRCSGDQSSSLEVVNHDDETNLPTPLGAEVCPC
jgi:hypothetical protein